MCVCVCVGRQAGGSVCVFCVDVLGGFEFPLVLVCRVLSDRDCVYVYGSTHVVLRNVFVFGPEVKERGRSHSRSQHRILLPWPPESQ